jgi:Neuraminidase (sialidase)
MYSQEGHVFYECTIGNKTLCYDITTGWWHTRASGSHDNRNRANCAIRFNDLVLVGDYQNGKIYEYSLSTYTDNGEPKRAIRIGQYPNTSGQKIPCGPFCLDMETSHTAGQIMLRISKDGGHTWSNERWRSIGEGYGNLIKWNRLGRSRRVPPVYEIVIADNVKRNINKAYIDV